MIIPIPFASTKKPHAEQHPNDVRPPEGYVRVRLDGGDSTTPVEERRYALVRAGYGEGARARRQRRRPRIYISDVDGREAAQ